MTPFPNEIEQPEPGGVNWTIRTPPAASSRKSMRPPAGLPHRARHLPQSLPLARGFERVAAIIKARGRPLTAFCACELRSPAPFTDAGFRGFNEVYVETLAKWGIYDAASKTNPVARSNVCPEIDPPAEPCFHAFSFTVASEEKTPTFVVAGSGEAREGGASYRERTVRYGRDQRRCDAREGGLRARRDGAPPGAPRLRLAAHQRHPGLHRARSLPLPRRRDRRAAVRRAPASPGTSAAHPCKASNTRWTAAASRSSISAE